MVAAADVRAAAARIRPIARRTPVLTSRLFDAEAGTHACFKAEIFQRGGAFKIRGAANFLKQIPAADLPRGVVAFSSGNHAQAVSIAAAELGTRATIVMPQDAPPAKLAATRAYGAEVILYDRLRDDREAIGRRVAAETGATLVPPFDHEWTIAGQGTVALELLEEYPDLEAIVVPIGGGGLISGCSLIAKEIAPHIRVIGVEPEDANDTYLSLQAGRRVTIAAPETIADGLRAPQPGALTFPIIQQLVDEIVLVSDREIQQAQAFLASRLKIVVEPSGAATAAAVLTGKLAPSLARVGVVLSGGNV
jgi:threonine dehydratase